MTGIQEKIQKGPLSQLLLNTYVCQCSAAPGTECLGRLWTKGLGQHLVIALEELASLVLETQFWTSYSTFLRTLHGLNEIMDMKCLA